VTRLHAIAMASKNFILFISESNLTLRFSCGARSASELKVKM